ncbi:LexA family protein [Dysosmobacter sp.]|jgi:repressor LexA|uniref:LexA family protein n=1 Tax=Dysosmobacter sp. TaxID=2591382 RepID=UPI003D94E37C
MEQLKVFRKKMGLTQADVADHLGIDRSTYAKYETGQSEPNFDMLQKISLLFRTSIDVLINGNAAPTSTGGKWIPVLGDVAAGIPIEAIEDIVDYEEIDAALAATGDFFGLRIKGSSMEPRIREGDVVIVRKQDDADTGDTAVIMVNGDSATVKRIKKEPDGSLVLIPNNPAYDAQHFSPAEILDKPVHIIGKVVELRGKF